MLTNNPCEARNYKFALPASVTLKDPVPKYKYVATGFVHICGITLEGALKCWSTTWSKNSSTQDCNQAFQRWMRDL